MGRKVTARTELFGGMRETGAAPPDIFPSEGTIVDF
jgi:hypothetical protein